MAKNTSVEVGILKPWGKSDDETVHVSYDRLREFGHDEDRVEFMLFPHDSLCITYQIPISSAKVFVEMIRKAIMESETRLVGTVDDLPDFE